MTLYASVNEIKTILGITGTAQDALLAIVAPAMQENFNEIIGVDGLLTATRTNTVRGHDNTYLVLPNFDIASITTIHEVRVAEDVQLTGWATRSIEGRLVWFDTWFEKDKRYKVVYSAGLATATSSIKMALAYMCGGAISANEGKNEGVSSYNIFGKQVSFRDQSEHDKFQTIAGKYARMYAKAEVFV